MRQFQGFFVIMILFFINCLQFRISPLDPETISGFLLNYCLTNRIPCFGPRSPTGILDPSFGNNGKVISPIIGTGTVNTGESIGIQSDGKIIIGGRCEDSSPTPKKDFCLKRFLSDGSTDSTFGNNGVVYNIDNPTANFDYGMALALQSDGKILLTGQCDSGSSYDFCSVRYTIDGNQDNSWGATGIVLNDIGASTSDSGNAVVIQSDGKIIIAGSCNSDFCLARYTSNGTLDNSWNTTGIIYVSGQPSSVNDMLESIAIQNDGKIVVGGACNAFDFCLARYNSDGTIDTSFGSSGYVITDLTTYADLGKDFIIRSDGKIIMAGACKPTNTDYNFCIIRYNSNGSIDTSFGNNGKVFTSILPSSSAISIVEQPDGKLIVGGYCRNGVGSDYEFCLVRYYENGNIDPGFGNNGIVITDLTSNDDILKDMKIYIDQNIYKIIAGGYCTNASSQNVFCLARYQ